LELVGASRGHRDIRIEDRRGRNRRYRAREREVAIRAPVVSLSHVSADRGVYPFFVFETFRQPFDSANARQRQLGPLMQLLYRTRYRSRLLLNRILSALYSNISIVGACWGMRREQIFCLIIDKQG